jgi:PilZ domain
MDLTAMNSHEDSGRAMNARRFPRHEIDMEIAVTTPEAKNWPVMRGRSLNINDAGMAGVFVCGWPAGTPVILKFLVPAVSSSISLDAIVRSRSDHRYGIEFMELNPVQREIISKTCRSLALL